MKKITLSRQFAFMREIMASKWHMSLGVLFIDMLLVGLSIAIPYIAKLQIDQLENQHQDLFGFMTGTPLLIFFWLLVLALGAALLQRVMQDVEQVVQNKVDFHFALEAEMRLYRKMEQFDIGFLQNPRNQRILWTISDAKRMVTDVIRFLNERLRSVLYIVGVLPLVALIDWTIFVAIVVTAVVQFGMSYVSSRINNTRRFQNETLQRRMWRVTNILNYELHNVLATAGLQKFMTDLHELRLADFEIEQKNRWTSSLFNYVDLVIDHLLLIVIGVLTARQVYEGTVSIGSFTMIMGYTTQLTSSVNSLLSAYTSWIDMYLTLIRVGFFLSLSSKLDMTQLRALDARPVGAIVCQNLSFAYPHYGEDERDYVEFVVQRAGKLIDANKPRYYHTEQKEWERLLESMDTPSVPVLKDVNVRFERNAMTAIVGRNGSGKTTLTNLLMRHYDPTEGDVSWAGRSLRTIDPVDMRTLVSVIQQEPFVMRDFTIRENVMLGVQEEVADEAIWKILEKVGLKEVVEKLHSGLDARLGEDAGFSGGQEQLLVIARILLQERPFVVFDEGTNQLDAEKEQRIIRLLEAYKKDRIIVMITHRMTSARKADKIVVMDAGQVAEQGTHDELMTNEKSLYRHFWDLQVEGKTPGDE